MAGDSEADAGRYGPLDEIDTKYEAFISEMLAANKCCGSCELFTDEHEDMSGRGWCQFSDGGTRRGKTCRHWSKRT